MQVVLSSYSFNFPRDEASKDLIHRVLAGVQIWVLPKGLCTSFSQRFSFLHLQMRFQEILKGSLMSRLISSSQQLLELRDKVYEQE